MEEAGTRNKNRSPPNLERITEMSIDTVTLLHNFINENQQLKTDLAEAKRVMDDVSRAVKEYPFNSEQAGSGTCFECEGETVYLADTGRIWLSYSNVSAVPLDSPATENLVLCLIAALNAKSETYDG